MGMRGRHGAASIAIVAAVVAGGCEIFDSEHGEEPVAEIACERNADCTMESPHCVGGVCLRCEVNADCDSTERCVDGGCEHDDACLLSALAVGRCALCDTAEDCGRGETCVSGSCVLASCAAAPDPRAYCRSAWWSGSPTPNIPGCTYHDGLRGSLDFCDGGATRLPATPLCDPCYRSLGGCGSEDACTDDLRCRCDRDTPCPEPTVCIDGYCGYRDCSEGLDCGCEHYCDGRRCRLLCDTDADCLSGLCDSVSGQCVHCRDDSDCSGTERCYENGCVEPCATDDDCYEMCTEDGRCEGCEAYVLGMPELSPRPTCE